MVGQEQGSFETAEVHYREAWDGETRYSNATADPI
jgi:hypothetical protein